MDFPGRATDIDEYFDLNSIISGGENWYGVCINHCRRKLDFPNTCSLFHRFSKYIKQIFACQCYRFISLVILANEGDFSHRAPTRFSPLLFMFLWILFLTKYDKIVSYRMTSHLFKKEVFYKRWYLATIKQNLQELPCYLRISMGW